MAFDVCSTNVRGRLKSVSTASFRNYYENDGEVVVSGSSDRPVHSDTTVDSENSFGAEIRTPFVCQVQAVGESGRLLDLALVE